MDPRSISISNYTYHLPDNRIARYPLAQRDASKLLVFQDGSITESVFGLLPSHLPENATLVVNNTRVINARLYFTTATNAHIEVFCLEPLHHLPSSVSHGAEIVWKCLIGNAAKWKYGPLHLHWGEHELTATLLEKLPDCFLVKFSWKDAELSFFDVLEQMGRIPIPPYLKRDSEISDTTNYQTAYAAQNGSVAAPTAGLHFTPDLMDKLKQRGNDMLQVTLHVGAGTFKPVKSATMEQHAMHAEWMDVDVRTIRQLQRLQNPVVSVGTTTLRTLESLYWMGVKCLLQKDVHEIPVVQQWDPYDLNADVPVADALAALIERMQQLGLQRILAPTAILIAPPYKVKMAYAIITNFHQPNSTLLLLVAAVIGNDWRKVYDYALEHDFRFLSYGDSSLLFAR